MLKILEYSPFLGLAPGRQSDHKQMASCGTVPSRPRRSWSVVAAQVRLIRDSSSNPLDKQADPN